MWGAGAGLEGTGNLKGSGDPPPSHFHSPEGQSDSTKEGDVPPCPQWRTSTALGAAGCVLVRGGSPTLQSKVGSREPGPAANPCIVCTMPFLPGNLNFAEISQKKGANISPCDAVQYGRTAGPEVPSVNRVAAAPGGRGGPGGLRCTVGCRHQGGIL